MATGKRYFWIKLRDSFMTSDTVDFLMSQKDGANYVVLYQMLCLKTINTGGRLSRQIGEYLIPYDVEKIQRDCKWFSADTVRVALNLYKALGLIYEDVDGTLVLTDHDSMVGSETDYAEKNRRIRAKQQAALPETGHNVSDDVSPNVTTDIEIRDKRLESRDKSTDTDSISQGDSNNNEIEDTTSSAERSDDHSAPEPAIFTLPLNDGSSYEVTQSEINEYSELYPAVDVAQEIRGMIGWIKANPTRRKTRRGIKRFMNSWLSRAQDQGGTKGGVRGEVYRGDSGGQQRTPFAGETVV